MALSPCTSHGVSAMISRTIPTYTATCSQSSVPVARVNRVTPQITMSTPSSTPPASPASRPARAFLVARQVMTSRYKGFRPATMGRSCRMGGVFPSRGRLGATITGSRPFGTVDFMIEIQELTKRYGPTTAVSDLTFTVRPGTVTGFLGPNGAGKSTTMRMILGLDEPTSGSGTGNGRPPQAHAAPLHEVGGMLDPRAVHPSRSAYHHLLALAQTTGLRKSRVDEVIDAVGLRSVARRPAGKFSLGMAQRLGIAAALLGDPATGVPAAALPAAPARGVLAEPVNGLDVEGIRWIRGLLRELAGAGKTVFVSSHLM